MQDLCQVKLLLANSGEDYEEIDTRRRGLEAQNYELEIEKTTLYTALIDAKLSLAESELGRQKITVAAKRDRNHRDLLGQRIAMLELKLAKEVARTDSMPNDFNEDAAFRPDNGGNRVRRKAAEGLQIFDDGDDEEIWEPPAFAKSSKSREIIRDSIRSQEIFSHLQPEQLKMIIGAMAEVKYA